MIAKLIVIIVLTVITVYVHEHLDKVCYKRHLKELELKRQKG